MLASLISQLAALESLTETQISAAIEQLTDDSIPVAIKAEFLVVLARKGETVAEIAAFARELRKRAVLPKLNNALRSRAILDVVGTGGDRLGTFNISTTAALVANWAFIPPYRAFSFDAGTLQRVGVFTVVALLISSMAASIVMTTGCGSSSTSTISTASSAT